MDRRKNKRYENLPTEEPIMARFKIKPDKAQETESDDWDLVDLMDISVVGAFYYYKQDLGLGTLLDLRIDISRSTPTINCVGKVIRSDKLQHTSLFCIAISFIDIGKQEKEMINTTLSDITTTHFIPY